MIATVAGPGAIEVVELAPRASFVGEFDVHVLALIEKLKIILF